MATKRKAANARTPTMKAKEEDKMQEEKIMQVDMDADEQGKEKLNVEKMEEKGDVEMSDAEENKGSDDEHMEEEEDADNSDEGSNDEELSEEEEEDQDLKKSKPDKPAAKKPKTAKSSSDATYLVNPSVSTYDMLVSAISSSEDRNGISVDGIKKYMKEHHPEKDWTKSKSHVKKALAKGLEDGTFVRPKKSENTTGLHGRFKINKESTVGKKVATEKPKKPSTNEVKVDAKAEKPRAPGRPKSTAAATNGTKTATTAVAKTAVKTKTTPFGNTMKTDKENEVSANKGRGAAKANVNTAVKATAAKSVGKATTVKAPPKSPKQPGKSPKPPVKSPKQPAKSPKQAPKSKAQK